MEEYRDHLSKIFKLFVRDEDINFYGEVPPEGVSLVDQILLSDLNMEKYWIPAVTHISYDVRPTSNWENLELLGDGYADSAFTNFFMKKFPNQTQLFYSETRNYYLGNSYIAEISRDTLLLTDFIRIKEIPEPTDSMLADCFESFCGALVLAGEERYLGFGLVLIEYFISYIFSEVDPFSDGSRTYGKPVTQIEQIFKRIKLPPVKVVYINDNYVHTFRYILLKSSIIELNKLLNNKKLVVKDQIVIGEYTGRGKSLVKDTAAQKALEYLDSFGIDTPWSQNIKNKRDLLEPAIKEYSLKALKKAQQEGYATIFFREVDKSENDNFIVTILVGVLPGGNQESLDVSIVDKQVDTKRRNEVILEGHRKVLLKYLGLEA